MADGVVLVQQAAGGDRAIDNEVVLNGAGQSVYRQRVVLAPLPTLAITQVAVGTSEVALPTIPLTGRKSVSVEALAANAAAVYVGLTGVTSLTGWELAAGASIDLDASDAVELYAVAASGTQRVAVAELA